MLDRLPAVAHTGEPRRSHPRSPARAALRKCRISVSRSRADRPTFVLSSRSSSAFHRPSRGWGCISRRYSTAVSSERRILRTVFRDKFRSRATCRIDLPFTRRSRRIRPIVATDQHPPPPASRRSRQARAHRQGGSILNADTPFNRVKFARRNTQGPRFGWISGYSPAGRPGRGGAGRWSID